VLVISLTFFSNSSIFEVIYNILKYNLYRHKLFTKIHITKWYNYWDVCKSDFFSLTQEFRNIFKK
jgi:hypothetical protein